MRKTFLTFCVAALSLLAVSSCYDDSSLWTEIDNLKDKIEALETRLNEQVSALNTVIGAVEAKVAVVKVEKNAAGNYVLTFSNNETLEISAADANANNTGLVTTVTEDGVTYWAVVGADGKVTKLDAVVHPDTKIQFKVDSETGLLMVSYDGKNYESTGVFVNDETTFNVVEDFVYTEGDEYFTLVIGGKEYQFPVYEADGSLVIGRTDVYFVYGASKKVQLTATDIEEYYVMSKPDGWKAVLDGTTLTVTAPAEELVKIGAGEEKGEVLVHATSVNGHCQVVKLDVTTGVALKLSIKDGVVTLFNAMLVEEKNPLYGDVWYNFSDVWFGLTPVTDYTAYESFDDFMATQPEPLSSLQNILFNNVEEQAEYVYVEGVYEEFVASMSLPAIVKGSDSGFELVEGEVYVMWAVPVGTSSYNYDEGVYVITDSYVEIEDKESLYNNVNMEAVFFGADGYVVGATDKTQFDEWGINEEFTYEDALAEYLIGSAWPGPLTSFNGGDTSAMGEMFTDGVHSLTLEDVIVSGGMGGGMMPMPGMGAGPAVSPDTEYFVWALPYYEDKTEYTFEDLVIITVKTEPLVYNENLKPTVTIGKVTATSAEVALVPVENGSTVFELMTIEDFEYFKNDGAVDVDMLVDYMKYGWALTQEELELMGVEEFKDPDDYSWLIEPSTTYVFVTYNRVAGEYSVDYSTTFTTPAEVELPTPDKKQWITTNTDFAEALSLGEARYVLDLGAVVSTDYADYGVTYAIAVSYEDIYGEDAAGVWQVGPGCFGSSYTITPEDEESGVLTINGYDVPYSGYTGTTCTFDFTAMFGVSDVEFTLSEEEIHVMIQ